MASSWHNVVALMQEVSAVGLVEQGGDSGNWVIASVLRNVTPWDGNGERYFSKANSPWSGGDVPPLSTTLVGPAIDQLKAFYGKKVCATVYREWKGGLSNTMGVINVAMDYSLLRGLTWIMPPIKPAQHDIGNSFLDVYGVEEECHERVVPVWKAECIGKGSGDGFDGTRTWKGGPCKPHETQFQDTHPDSYMSTHCGCDAFIRFGRTHWHFFYEKTGPVLSSMYWKDKDMPDFEFPLSTVHHVRLGDVEGSGNSKFVNGTIMATMVDAFANFSRIDARCLRVTIVTDGERDDEHVKKVAQAWKDKGVEYIRISDKNDPVTDALYMMTHAGILVGGASGFPRFAAVISKSKVKLFYGDPEMDHPIAFLKGAISLPYGASFDMMEAAMRYNVELNEIASSCSRWLNH